MRTFLRSWLRGATGVLLGALTALVTLPFLVVGGLWLLATLGRRAERGPASPARQAGPVGGSATPAGSWVPRGARRLAEVERRRVARCYRLEVAPPRGGRGAFGYLAAHCALGLLGGLVLLALLVGAGYASLLVWAWFLVGTLNHLGDVLFSAVLGLFLLFLSAQAVHGVGLMDQQLARHHLGPSDRDLLERRIGELAASRAGIVAAVHDERRRIERDLHDGMQQRLVALGMLLGRARRAPDPERAARLLDQAHQESQRALTELREVAWRVYPASLDDGGLPAALEQVAERAGLPVRLTTAGLTGGVDGEPAGDGGGAGDGADLPPVVRTVAYFVVAEAVTNAVKHAGATRIDVRVVREGSMVRVWIEDDGSGGANPSGGGLLGLARRVAALDGRFRVDSPAGGPTVIAVELPCA